MIANIEMSKTPGYEPQDTFVWMKEAVKAFLQKLALSQGYKYRDVEKHIAAIMSCMLMLKLSHWY